jgi:hypothetical protein
MYYVIIPAVIGMGILLSALMGLPTQSDNRAEQARGQVSQYQTFMYTAKTYFERNAAPAANTNYYWATLKAAATPAMMQAGIPPYWKAVRRADGTWVACTEMSETSANKIPSLFPVQSATVGTQTLTIVPTAVGASSITSVVGAGGGSQSGVTHTYVVVGQMTTTAALSANLCAGT